MVFKFTGDQSVGQVIATPTSQLGGEARRYEIRRLEIVEKRYGVHMNSEQRRRLDELRAAEQAGIQPEGGGLALSSADFERRRGAAQISGEVERQKRLDEAGYTTQRATQTILLGQQEEGGIRKPTPETYDISTPTTPSQKKYPWVKSGLTPSDMEAERALFRAEEARKESKAAAEQKYLFEKGTLTGFGDVAAQQFFTGVRSAKDIEVQAKQARAAYQSFKVQRQQAQQEKIGFEFFKELKKERKEDIPLQPTFSTRVGKEVEKRFETSGKRMDELYAKGIYKPSDVKFKEALTTTTPTGKIKKIKKDIGAFDIAKLGRTGVYYTGAATKEVFYDYPKGYVKGIEEKPFKTLGSYAIALAAPGAFSLVSKGAKLTTKVTGLSYAWRQYSTAYPFAAAKLSGVAAAAPGVLGKAAFGIYGGSIGVRVATAPRGEKFYKLGEITSTEVAPFWAGSASAAYVYPKVGQLYAKATRPFTRQQARGTIKPDVAIGQERYAKFGLRTKGGGYKTPSTPKERSIQARLQLAEAKKDPWALAAPEEQFLRGGKNVNLYRRVPGGKTGRTFAEKWKPRIVGGKLKFGYKPGTFRKFGGERGLLPSATPDIKPFIKGYYVESKFFTSELPGQYFGTTGTSPEFLKIGMTPSYTFYGGGFASPYPKPGVAYVKPAGLVVNPAAPVKPYTVEGAPKPFKWAPTRDPKIGEFYIPGMKVEGETIAVKGTELIPYDPGVGKKFFGKWQGTIYDIETFRALSATETTQLATTGKLGGQTLAEIQAAGRASSYYYGAGAKVPVVTPAGIISQATYSSKYTAPSVSYTPSYFSTTSSVSSYVAPSSSGISIVSRPSVSRPSTSRVSYYSGGYAPSVSAVSQPSVPSKPSISSVSGSSVSGYSGSSSISRSSYGYLKTPTTSTPPYKPFKIGFEQKRSRSLKGAGRKFRYTPTLVGATFSAPISKAPKGLVPGFLVRPTVKRKVKKQVTTKKKKKKKKTGGKKR